MSPNANNPNLPHLLFIYEFINLWFSDRWTGSTPLDYFLRWYLKSKENIQKNLQEMQDQIREEVLPEFISYIEEEYFHCF